MVKRWAFIFEQYLMVLCGKTNLWYANNLTFLVNFKLFLRRKLLINLSSPPEVLLNWFRIFYSGRNGDRRFCHLRFNDAVKKWGEFIYLFFFILLNCNFFYGSCGIVDIASIMSCIDSRVWATCDDATDGIIEKLLWFSFLFSGLEFLTTAYILVHFWLTLEF